MQEPNQSGSTRPSEFIWSCARKKKYRVKKHAELSIEHGEKSGFYAPGTKHVYSCRFCLGYHIGALKPGEVVQLETPTQLIGADWFGKSNVRAKQIEHKLNFLDNYPVAFLHEQYAYIQKTNKNYYKTLNLGWARVSVLDTQEEMMCKKIEACRRQGFMTE